MLDHSQVDELVFDLFMKQKAHIQVEDELLALSLSNDMKSLTISTRVFRGQQYLPQSIRRGIQAEACFPYAFIKPHFTVDEENYSIDLNLTQNIGERGFSEFDDWLEDFLWMAHEWRFILEKYGKEDLIFVYVKK